MCQKSAAGKHQQQGNEWLWDLGFLLVCKWNTWHKAITLLCTAISCSLESFFLMFFPQLEINMDRRQNCLIDLSFSCYSFCNISLNPITADLVAAGLRGVTFLFYPLPGSWVWEGFFLYKKKNYLFSNFTRRVSLHIHLYLQAKPAPKVSVNALIKKGIISQRIERETVFWFTCLFVCLFLLSSVFPCARLRNHLHGTEFFQTQKHQNCYLACQLICLNF